MKQIKQICVLFFIFSMFCSANHHHKDDANHKLSSNKQIVESVHNESYIGISVDDLNTILLDAVLAGDIERTSTMIENGADVNCIGGAGFTPLRLADEGGKTEIALVLIKNGAAVNIKDKESFTPLMAAAHEGHSHTVDILLENGADVNARDINDFTPLMLSVLENHIDLVNTLIAKGARVNVEAIDGSTPLSMAMNLGYMDIVCLLLERGAIPKHQRPGTGVLLTT